MHGRSFKKRAPWAVKSVIEFAQKMMGTSDVHLDPKLTQAVWAQGIETVPHRLRVRLESKHNNDESDKEKLFTYVSHVPVTSFKGLQTVVIEAECSVRARLVFVCITLPPCASYMQSMLPMPLSIPVIHRIKSR